MQLIKTAIIKAGNGPAVFVAAAQRSTEAGMAPLPCICSWVPPGRFPMLPDGPLRRPDSSRNGIDCLWQAAVLGRPTVCSICSSSIYVVLAVCQSPCHPSPAHDSPGCYAGLFLLVRTVANSPSSSLSKPPALPWALSPLISSSRPVVSLPEALVGSSSPETCQPHPCSAPRASVTASLSVPILSAQPRHILYELQVPHSMDAVRISPYHG